MSQAVASSPVHSVSPPLPPQIHSPELPFPTKLTLELRGTRFEIDREMLMSLPESILIVMFPNGLMLNRALDYEDDVAEDDNSVHSIDIEDQIVDVDFDPSCLEYILNFYKTAQEAFYSNQGSTSTAFPHSPQNPLLSKQAIIVLREELDYFTIPPKSSQKHNISTEATGKGTLNNTTTETTALSGTSSITAANETSDSEQAIDIFELKTECGSYLLNQKKIFTALQRNINKENNVAEQHLIDMLCVSGFSRDDEWGYRNIEPLKTSIVSIALVMLKTTGQGNQMATAQKLLLFWRKPARKCWWDGLEIKVFGDRAVPIRLWCRRTWTLELALILEFNNGSKKQSENYNQISLEPSIRIEKPPLMLIELINVYKTVKGVFGNGYLKFAKEYYVEIQIEHLELQDRDLFEIFKKHPSEIIPLLESAIRTRAQRTLNQDDIPTFQALLKYSQKEIINMRQLSASSISNLVRISGIVIAATNLTSKATHIHIMCKTCRHSKTLVVSGGFSGISLPRACDGDQTGVGPKDCGLDPYVVLHDKCLYVDQQVLKVQECPDLLPVGDLPRHITVHVDRYLTDKVAPGNRVNILGIYDIYQNSSAKRQNQSIGTRIPYVRALSIEFDENQSGTNHNTFTHSEEEEMIQMSRNPNFYNIFTSSIAPSIYGNEDIKRAITCLLFGGSKKILEDGMRLRGDIHVLLLGDPGTAKSKGSSAAGLTAAVIRDPSTGDFYLEAGAMVLSDGGVICIDEFDKMREEDRVAIHEAMEQQTISIAKAGITAVLNTRASVLAAANPQFGRYDDMKTPGENIDFQTTILSRFDMIFIVRDECNQQRDMNIARHVMNVHMHKTQPEAEGELEIVKMKKYISYAKLKCAPRLSDEAIEKLSNYFVTIRDDVKRLEQDSKTRSSIPITVRQLEAIIRISESLAKVTLSPCVSEEHVDEAMRLFKSSTVNALQVGEVEGMSHTEMSSQVQVVEREIINRLPMGSRASIQRLTTDLENHFPAVIVKRAIDILIRREMIQYVNRGRMIYRIGG
ncbi:5009_t:CDS:10 [Entrophospora sp. SA101]|nr:5009_t:CDS:10 [Entrophospora sp. SA101]